MNPMRLQFVWLTVLVSLAGIGSAQGQGFDYQFNADGALPGGKGAVHAGSSGLKESAVYSVKGGYLYGNTLGTGKYSYYVVDRFFNHAFRASLVWKAKVIQNDGEAVVISAASGPNAWNFNLAAGGVEVQQQGGWLLAVPMNTGDAFHTYRVEIPSNDTGFDLYVDDILLYSGHAMTTAKNSATVSFGDTVGKGDSSVVWDSITLTQKVSFSLTMPSAFSKVSSLSDQTKAARTGSTIPLKLQLLNAIGENVSSPELTVEAVAVTFVSSSAPGSLVGDDAGVGQDPNFRYDATLGGTGGYIYRLSTQGLSTGTYHVVFNVGGDPTLHTLQFQIR